MADVPKCKKCGQDNPRESWPSCQRDKYTEDECYKCKQSQCQKTCNKSSGGGCCGGRKSQEETKPLPQPVDPEAPASAGGGCSKIGPDAMLHMDDVKKTVLALCAKVGVGPIGLTSTFP